MYRRTENILKAYDFSERDVSVNTNPKVTGDCCSWNLKLNEPLKINEQLNSFTYPSSSQVVVEVHFSTGVALMFDRVHEQLSISQTVSNVVATSFPIKAFLTSQFFMIFDASTIGEFVAATRTGHFVYDCGWRNCIDKGTFPARCQLKFLILLTLRRHSK